MFRSPDEIRGAYRDEQVAREYIDRRFREPLGQLLHDRQVAVVRREFKALGTPRVLELAPGPARLTADLASALPRGVAIDASLQMLGEARRRLEAAGAAHWRFVQGDAFQLPFHEPFDLVYTFRLIRHFEAGDRQRLYREIGRMLRPGGVLVFDAVNEVVSQPLRDRNPGEYKHFDALFRPDALVRELRDAGFTNIALEGIQHRLGLLTKLQVFVAPRSRPLARALMDLVDRTGGEPLEWIVTCRRA